MVQLFLILLKNKFNIAKKFFKNMIFVEVWFFEVITRTASIITLLILDF